jgi:hypothetical protein
MTDNRFVQLEQKVQELERKLNEKPSRDDILNEVKARTNNSAGIQRVLGGAIQSGNFQEGTAGWRLSSDGTLEAIEGVFSGDISGATFTATHFSGITIDASTITGTSISGGTVTGTTIQTAASGPRVRLRHDSGMGTVEMLNDDLLYATMTPYSSIQGTGIKTVTHGEYVGECGFVAQENISSGMASLYVADVPVLTAYSDNISSITILPPTTDDYDLGSDSLRWDTVYTNAVDTGDISFDNGWKLTESDKVGIEEEGMVFVNKEGKPICIINNNGIKNIN